MDSPTGSTRLPVAPAALAAPAPSTPQHPTAAPPAGLGLSRQETPLLPCGLTAAELAVLTTELEECRNSLSASAGLGLVAGRAGGSAAPVAAASPASGSDLCSRPLADPMPCTGSPPGTTAGRFANSNASPGSASSSGGASSSLAAIAASALAAAGRAVGQDSDEAHEHERRRRSFERVNRVAAAVAAEKARRRWQQRESIEGAAARPRSHNALHVLGGQPLGQPSSAQPRAQQQQAQQQQARAQGQAAERALRQLLARQRSASEGQLEGLLVGPVTPCHSAEALSVARHLAALSTTGPTGASSALPAGASSAHHDADAAAAAAADATTAGGGTADWGHRGHGRTAAERLGGVGSPARGPGGRPRPIALSAPEPTGSIAWRPAEGPLGRGGGMPRWRDPLLEEMGAADPGISSEAGVGLPGVAAAGSGRVAAAPAAGAPAAAAAEEEGEGEEGEEKAPFPQDPGLSWFAATSPVATAAVAAAGILSPPGPSTPDRLSLEGYHGYGANAAAASQPGPPGRPAASAPFPRDSRDGKSVAPQPARPSPSTPAALKLSPSHKQKTGEPGTPGRKKGALVSAFNRLLRL